MPLANRKGRKGLGWLHETNLLALIGSLAVVIPTESETMNLRDHLPLNLYVEGACAWIGPY